MADPTPDRDTDDETGTPLWVKVFGITALVIVVLFLILMLTRGPGGHGPRRHMPSGSVGDDASPANMTTGSIGSKGPA